MDPGLLPPWPVVGSAAGGVGAVMLAWTLRAYRGKPGVDWFLGVFAAQALWCLSYAAGLLATDPLVREVLELSTWLGIVWTGVAFLGFALEYTGRADVVRGRLFGSVVGFGLVSTALLVTNPVHGAYWTGFQRDPVFGIETVAYAIGPWGYLVVAVETVLVASAVFLLVDTLLSYGPLYRRETAAVALSPLPPGFALVAWALGVGPAEQLQLAPVMFVPHVALDAYAFARAEMFERNPTTSRAAERTAIDDLSDPIVALALDERIVRLNPAAEALLGVDAATARDRPIGEFLPIEVAVDGDSGGTGGEGDDAAAGTGGEGDDAAAGAGDGGDGGTGEITVGSARGRRTYAVSTSRLTDPNDTHVGYTVVLSDVTERERRRQQLEVLNRILRHNLRNDAGVVHGYAELLVERIEDDDLAGMADAVERRSAALAALGDKASTVESLLDEAQPTTLSVGDLVGRVVEEHRSEHPDAVVELDVRGDVTADLREDALRAIVANAVENAIEHHDGEGVERADGGPWVRVTVDRDDRRDDHGGDVVVVAVADDGPGVPEHEVAAVESGRETALEHGSGLGMWVVEWAAGALGADVSYADRDPRGTTVTVRIPVAEGPPRADGEPAGDAGSDAIADAGSDAMADAGSDATADAGSDATADAGSDAMTD